LYNIILVPQKESAAPPGGASKGGAGAGVATECRRQQWEVLHVNI